MQTFLRKVGTVAEIEKYLVVEVWAVVFDGIVERAIVVVAGELVTPVIDEAATAAGRICPLLAFSEANSSDPVKGVQEVVQSVSMILQQGWEQEW
jgi:hypothetical protein